MDLKNTTKKLNSLEKLVKELLCKIGNESETDPTVPFYVKNLKEEEVSSLLLKLNTPLGEW